MRNGSTVPPHSGATSAPRDCASARRRSAPCCRAACSSSAAGSWSAMTETRLSFVIPARNEEALIGEVLEAILVSVAQACGVTRSRLRLQDTAFEVIVADDGSEDATAAIVGGFADAGVQLVP